MELKALETFRVNDDSLPLSFIKRLAMENAWELSFAEQAFQEYLKFIYLCVETPGLTVPSDVVDEVWHLHLTYTKSYWKDLCGDLLGKELHHIPTQGGASEDSKFSKAYDDTLARYEQTFGHPAPQKFWPSPEERFRPISNVIKVDRSRTIVLPRQVLYSSLGALALILMVLGCSGEDGASSIIALFLFVILALALFKIKRRSERKPSKQRRKGKKRGGWFGCGAGSCGGSSDGGGCGGGGCGGGCGGG